jgi:sulfite dehydrogenase (cytochrome) subunit B
MKPWMFATLLFLAPSAVATRGAADESKISLKDAPGRDLVVKNCATCHSLDYVQMNSGFLDAKGWEATVNKMVKALNAPIPVDAIPKIVEYLARNYGK